jgi:hypothetical protein
VSELLQSAEHYQTTGRQHASVTFLPVLGTDTLSAICCCSHKKKTLFASKIWLNRWCQSHSVTELCILYYL